MRNPDRGVHEEVFSEPPSATVRSGAAGSAVTQIDVTPILDSVLRSLYPGAAPWDARIARLGFRGLDRLTRERLAKLGSGFTASNYERALREVIRQALDSTTEQRSRASRTSRLRVLCCAEHAHAALAARGVDWRHASAEELLEAYRDAEAEQNVSKQELPVQGEDLDAGIGRSSDESSVVRQSLAQPA